MSTDLATIQEQIQLEIEAQRENIQPTGGRINTKGKVFTLPDGTSLTGKLNAVILDYRFQNTYYKAAWDGQSANRPDCIATGKNQEELVPNSDIEEPVNHDCASCPMNEWGSSSNGRGGKACQNKVRLALVTADADDRTPIYTLDLTPTALPSFNAFMDGCNKHKSLPINFIAEIWFDEKSSFPSIRLKAIGENEDYGIHWKLRERAQHIL